MTADRLSEEDVACIRKVIEAACQDLCDGDFASWIAHWTPDVVQMPPNSGVIRGREAVVEWMQDFPDLVEMTTADMEIDGRQDLAVVTSTVSMTYESPGEGEAEGHAKQLLVLRKQSDGQWLIATSIFNSNTPPAG